MVFFFWVAVLAATGLHLWLSGRPRTAALVVEVLLLYLLVLLVGISGLMAGLAHIFLAQEVALKIGWQPGSPFQFEVAMADLAFGILGILCFWQRGGFWTATIIGYAIFLLGCAYGHVREAMVAGNFAPYNVGIMIWLNDVGLPVLLLALLWARGRLTAKGATAP